MDIKEKTVIRHSFHFTWEDLDLIKSVVLDVWKLSDISVLVTNHLFASSFSNVLYAINKVAESALHQNDITYEDDKVLVTLADTFCTFESKFENDPRFDKVDEMWRQIIRIRKSGEEY